MSISSKRPFSDPVPATLPAGTPPPWDTPLDYATTTNDTQDVTSRKLFDITAVIGSVYSGGTMNPRVVAFSLIGEHGAPGEYSFPDEDGTLTVVRVEMGVTPNQKER